jgi:hypothetical protein
MAFRKLTVEGKDYIKTACNGNGNSLLSGKSIYKITDTKSEYYNPNAVLPLFYPRPPRTSIAEYNAWINNIVTWISNPAINGNITTNSQLGDAIIKWYDKYGEIFQMDANVLAAQTYQESKYCVWAYPLTSTAAGISQFTSDTVIDIIIKNKHTKEIEATLPKTDPNLLKFSDAEIAKITKNVTGEIKDNATYDIGSTLGRENRPIMHQNITDNPELLIKAQYRYMKYIASKCNSLTSATLFGYSRGPYGYAYSSYILAINKASQHAPVGVKKEPYEDEGINYVFNIFCILGDKNNELSKNKLPGKHFGYDKGASGNIDLGMRKGIVFDETVAKGLDSNIQYGK